MLQSPASQETDVVIIGGGATGAGIARDRSAAACVVFCWSVTTSPRARLAVIMVCYTAVPVMR